MRVLFLLSRPVPARGGFQTTLRVAGGLACRGHDVELWIGQGALPPAHGWPEGVTVRVLTEAGTPGDGQPSRAVPPEWDQACSLATDRAFRESLAQSRADVVVTGSWGTLLAGAHWLPRDVPIVHHLRHRPAVQRTAVEVLRAWGPRLAAVVVGHRLAGEALARALGPLLPPVRVVPDPLGRERVPPAIEDSRVVVSAGRFARDQHMESLVRAFGRAAEDLPGWRLRLFGDGSSRGAILAAARKAGLYDRVELPGVVPDMSVEWARAGIAVSTGSGVAPLVVGEAMAAGLPVVAHSYPGGAATWITHGVDGLLVRPGSLSGTAHALVELARDAPLRARLGEAAAGRVRGLRPSAVVPQWESVLAEVAERRSDARSLPEPEGDSDGGARIESSPTSARAEILGALVAAARAVGDDWMVLRPHLGAPPVVVMPTDVRQRFLAELRHLPPLLHAVEPSESQLGTATSLGSLPRIWEDLVGLQPDRLVVSRDPWTDGRPALDALGGQVAVEFWGRVDGGYEPPVPNEWVLVWRDDDPLVDSRVDDVPVRSLPLTTAPTVVEVTAPIDVVYTWVDGNDPAWVARRDARLAAATDLATASASSGRARYTSRDELRYSMRSVHLFAPWVRHIHLVTDRQVPVWLDTGHPRVSVVDHRDLLPEQHLPTFNSHAIETALHRIDGLAEQFLYVNDDVLLGRPMTPERFFSPAGHFAVFLSDHRLGEDAQGVPPFRRAGLNNRRLLQRDFGVTSTRLLKHTPHPFTRTLLAEVERRYAPEVEITRAHPFRSEHDISVTASLGQHLGLVTGVAFAAEIELVNVALTGDDVLARLTRLLATRGAEVVGLPDHHSWAVPETLVNRRLADFLEDYFPVPAPWEH